MLKRLKTNLRYNFGFLRVLNSPFKGLKLSFYFGEIAMGTPYFLPRKWVKFTEEDAIEWAKKQQANENLIYKNKSFEEVVEEGKKYTKAVSIKYFGWNYHSLGWKTKFEDYRFEFNPGLSIVLFGKQFCITIKPNIEKPCWDDIFWEAWLTYLHETNKNLSKIDRLKQLVEKHTCTWKQYSGGDVTTTDYYPFILKKKYLKYYKPKNI